ncbi:uncharacterized protein N7479_007446 [Penicillium vulpinum]|uniref:uncharacterized protein n=1 Tax=Penicillium vulpinum TaxID=29845 RepID=UPI00254931FC|nr:uncharacterized protein N7479_007446 [Penicillium vulpinum]KAJ5960296.1 hypothetical protein N7479_007446 [Penicillium vulpinum]
MCDLEEKSPTNSVVLPPSYTSITPCESFPDTTCGILTWHTLLSHPTTPTADLIADIAVCPAKTGRLCPHRHTQAEVYYILRGRGEVTIDGMKHQVTEGSTVVEMVECLGASGINPSVVDR